LPFWNSYVSLKWLVIASLFVNAWITLRIDRDRFKRKLHFWSKPNQNDICQDSNVICQSLELFNLFVTHVNWFIGVFKVALQTYLPMHSTKSRPALNWVSVTLWSNLTWTELANWIQIVFDFNLRNTLLLPSV